MLALSARIGEKLELGRYVHVDGPVALYLHRRSSDLPPADRCPRGVRGLGRERRPRRRDADRADARRSTCTRDEVPADVWRTSGGSPRPPPARRASPSRRCRKIVEGRVNGFYKDVVLLEQASVQEPKKTVKALLDEAGVTVKGFARFEVGQA